MYAGNFHGIYELIEQTITQDSKAFTDCMERGLAPGLIPKL